MWSDNFDLNWSSGIINGLGVDQPNISVTQSVLDICVNRVVFIYFLTLLTKNSFLGFDR